jgi:hypothetical protein
MFAMRKRGMKGEALCLPPGYEWKSDPSPNHVGIVCPDGSKLRMPNGIPVKCSMTPSDYRTRKTEWSRIKKALRSRGETI